MKFKLLLPIALALGLAACAAATVLSLIAVGVGLGEQIAVQQGVDPRVIAVAVAAMDGFTCASDESATMDSKPIKSVKIAACFAPALALVPGLPPELNAGLIKSILSDINQLLATAQTPPSSAITAHEAVKPDVVAPGDVLKLKGLAARSHLAAAELRSRR